MVRQSTLWAELAKGRYAMSAGHVQEIAARLMQDSRTSERQELLSLLQDENPGVAMRAADVLERISAHPSPAIVRLLAGNKALLLESLTHSASKKARWNLALVIGRLPLSLDEARWVSELLHSWLDDPSSVIRTVALQGLADMATINPSLLPGVLDLLRVRGQSGTPAMRARTRHLLAKLDPDRPRPTRRRIAPTPPDTLAD